MLSSGPDPTPHQNRPPPIPPLVSAPREEPASAFGALATPTLAAPSPAPIPRPLRTCDEISSDMRVRGFPELERSWKHFLRLKIEPERIDERALDAEREVHKRPFGSRPWIMGTAIGGAALAGIWAGQLNLPESLSPIVSGCLAAWSALNFAFLGTYATMMLRRASSSSFERIMAMEMGRMLSKPDFREWFSEQPRTVEAVKTLRALGVNESWDNPAYCRRYRAAGENVESVPVLSRQEEITAVLREFLGAKDPLKRKFLPGRFIESLNGGKSSVTEFVARFGAELELNRQGRLGEEAALALVRSLASDFVKPGSEGARAIGQRLAALEDPDRLPAGVIEARIWARDPWRDLTHQEEFFSSASLRGVKLLGRNSKGRLGTFDYLHNPSISALDLSVDDHRSVRVRMGAASVESARGGEVAALFVDGVEGAGALSQRVIRTAVEDFARECGFKAVVYNAFVHNQTPKKFIHSLERSDLEKVEVNIAYADHGTREYLDTFGVTLPPFEYAYPKGSMIGYVSELDSESPIKTCTPGFMSRCKSFLKENSLWILVGQAIGFEAAAIGMASPKYLVPLLALQAAAFVVNHRFQRRSQKHDAAAE